MDDTQHGTIEVEAVMFGEPLPGSDKLAPADCVVVSLEGCGQSVSLMLDPAAAMDAAKALSSSVGYLANHSVGDGGRRLSLLERLSFLRGTW